MRSQVCKQLFRSSSAPVYTFDTDVDIERVIRDPMAVLLGRTSLRVQHESSNTDPYNRVGNRAHNHTGNHVGRWVRAR